MARKDAKDSHHHRGMRDIVGFVLIIAAVLLLLAQVSFDRQDLAVNRFPPNQTPHNWIGTAGAVVAHSLFFLFGAGAFLIPFLLIGFGLAYLVEAFAYLKRRWAWTAVLFISSLGFFDLYTSHLAGLQANLNAPSAGGLIGQTMNDKVFRSCGILGATIIFATVYVVSLVFLTNFRLSNWLRAWFAREAVEEDSPDWSPEERALDRRARDLEKQARRLQEQVERNTGLGPDLKPVPAPTVRDLSVPQSRPQKSAKQKAEPEPETSGQTTT